MAHTNIPPSLQSYLTDLDAFIESTITPLQNSHDNARFFDHRREPSRTLFSAATLPGRPNPAWTALLHQCVALADAAGFWRFSLPGRYGGQQPDTTDATSGRVCNLWMAVIREHLAAKGLGLFNDLQTEHSVVGNFPVVFMLLDWGSEGQKEELIPGMLQGRVRPTFGLTEPEHGSDATFMDSTGRRETRDGVEGWVLDGRKAWQTGIDAATCSLAVVRTSGKRGDSDGLTCFIVPTSAPGFKVEGLEWTFNMPTDHGTYSLSSVFVPDTSRLGPLGGGLNVAMTFVQENRIRQAASSLGAASYCIDRSIEHARRRRPFGRPLASNQAIQFPLVELRTTATMLRLLIRQTAEEMDERARRSRGAPRPKGASRPEEAPGEVTTSSTSPLSLRGKVSMTNYTANRLACTASDLAIQIHGGMGYSRSLPFEHIYRHHRRYRITEGSEEVQMRGVALAMGLGGGGRERGARL
ncbi:MAG: hypothetical protein M1828_003567 [Chrysothrix sp. TS-e1954]|nr:MAG: hypothetical protein M1828_003567 [Chrysothrix sp. TS-e1954]